MSIAAQRFQRLDIDSNVPIADIYTASNVGVLNDVLKDTQGIIDKLSSILNKNTLISLATSATTRITQDLFSGIQNFTGLDIKAYQSQVNNIFNTASHLGSTISSVTSSFRQLESTTQQEILKFTNTNFNLKDFGSFDGALHAIDRLTTTIPAGFQDFVGKFTLGTYTPTASNHNVLAGLLSGVINKGYECGFPDVFAQVTQSQPVEVATAVAHQLVYSLGAIKNTHGLIDVLKSDVSSTLKTIDHDIGAVVAKGFTIPVKTTVAAAETLYHDYKTAVHTMDSAWDESFGLPSTKYLKQNVELAQTAIQEAKKIAAIPSQLATIPLMVKDEINGCVLQLKKAVDIKAQFKTLHWSH